MERYEIVTITNMCMVYDGNKAVVQNRKDPKWGGIVFPGGHVEKGESFTDSAIREVFEETGLTIYNPMLCGVKDWTKDDGRRYIVLLYKTDKFEGELKSSDEGEVFWASLDDLHKMTLGKDFGDMLKVFTDDNLSEFYYYKEDGEWKYNLK